MLFSFSLSTVQTWDWGPFFMVQTNKTMEAKRVRNELSGPNPLFVLLPLQTFPTRRGGEGWIKSLKINKINHLNEILFSKDVRVQSCLFKRPKTPLMDQNLTVSPMRSSNCLPRNQCNNLFDRYLKLLRNKYITTSLSFIDRQMDWCCFASFFYMRLNRIGCLSQAADQRIEWSQCSTPAVVKLLQLAVCPTLFNIKRAQTQKRSDTNNECFTYVSRISKIITFSKSHKVLMSHGELHHGRGNRLTPCAA